MNVKIDTKEKFTVITATEADISANMTGRLAEMLLPRISLDIPHVVLNMKEVKIISDEAAEMIADLQQQFYEQNVSFIVCELQNEVKAVFDRLELTDVMNITPTESEAWDIVQMEEIEREIMGGFDNGAEA